MVATIIADKVKEINISSESHAEPINSSISNSESDHSSNFLSVEPEDSKVQVGNASDNKSSRLKAETEQIKVDQGSACNEEYYEMPSGPSECKYSVSITSAKFWKLVSAPAGKQGVICPGCKTSTGNEIIVILKKFWYHTVRAHPKILGQSLLCPDCKTEVLPSEIKAHSKARCFRPASS